MIRGAVILLGAAAELHAAASSGSPLAASPPQVVGNWPPQHRRVAPIPLKSVQLGGFLGQHVDASNRSLLAGLDSPIPKAFDARAAGQEPPTTCRRLATDSDFYKWLEAACYALIYNPQQSELRAAVDRYARIIAALQEPGGYIGTRISPAGPFDEKVRHDLYVGGHLIEAAVAHHELTANRQLLDAAVRLADFYLQAFRQKHPYFRLITQEHPEIELALVRLGRATGEHRFIEFAADLTPLARLTQPLAEVRAGASARHAVRLAYQLTGAAELYLQTGDDQFLAPLMPLWNEIVDTRMYITGGIGANEIIPREPYDLPQTLDKGGRDIAETCASISFMMLSWRLHAIEGGDDQGRIFDTIETMLYNEVLGALSPDHCANFYYNPLRRVGDLTGKTDHGGNPVQRTRLPQIHSTACCLPNAWRFFAQLPEYVFSTSDTAVYVNLYTTAQMKTAIDGQQIGLEMETDYPHDGHVRITVRTAQPVRFELVLRRPAWCTGGMVRIGGDSTVLKQSRGFDRVWHDGDSIELELPMTPQVVAPQPVVTANAGQIALRRGPLIYCSERQDAAGIPLEQLRVKASTLRESSSPRSDYRVLQAEAVDSTGAAQSPRTVSFVPFYARANRSDNSRWLTWVTADAAQ